MDKEINYQLVGEGEVGGEYADDAVDPHPSLLLTLLFSHYTLRSAP